jgi:hypothetical protein
MKFWPTCGRSRGRNHDKVSALCWKVPLAATEKLVLLRLADFADDGGFNIYPAVQTVSQDTGCSTHTGATLCCGVLRSVLRAAPRAHGRDAGRQLGIGQGGGGSPRAWARPCYAMYCKRNTGRLPAHFAQQRFAGVYRPVIVTAPFRTAGPGHRSR